MAKRRRRWFLRAWREHRKLSQEKLGQLVGVTQGMISQLEGGTSDYTGDMLDKLAKALDCSVYQLLFQDPKVADDPAAIYVTLPPYEQEQAMELLRGLQRTTSRRP